MMYLTYIKLNVLYKIGSSNLSERRLITDSWIHYEVKVIKGTLRW